MWVTRDEVRETAFLKWVGVSENGIGFVWRIGFFGPGATAGALIYKGSETGKALGRLAEIGVVED